MKICARIVCFFYFQFVIVNGFSQLPASSVYYIENFLASLSQWPGVQSSNEFTYLAGGVIKGNVTFNDRIDLTSTHFGKSCRFSCLEFYTGTNTPDFLSVKYRFNLYKEINGKDVLVSYFDNNVPILPSFITAYENAIINDPDLSSCKSVLLKIKLSLIYSVTNTYVINSLVNDPALSSCNTKQMQVHVSFNKNLYSGVPLGQKTSSTILNFNSQVEIPFPVTGFRMINCRRQERKLKLVPDQYYNTFFKEKLYNLFTFSSAPGTKFFRVKLVDSSSCKSNIVAYNSAYTTIPSVKYQCNFGVGASATAVTPTANTLMYADTINNYIYFNTANKEWDKSYCKKDSMPLQLYAINPKCILYTWAFIPHYFEPMPIIVDKVLDFKRGNLGFGFGGNLNDGICSAFPNPSTNEVFLKSPNGFLTINVLDVTGKRVMPERRVQQKTSSERINIALLKPGVYIFEIIDRRNQKNVLKVIKK